MKDFADDAAEKIVAKYPFSPCQEDQIKATAAIIRQAQPDVTRLVEDMREFIKWWDESRRCERETGRNSMATTEAHTEEYEALEKVRSALAQFKAEPKKGDSE